MILSVISVLAMGLMFIQMMRKASLPSTRKMAVLPLTACLMEMIATGALHPGQFPLLTVVLVLLRASILFCCAGALRKDVLARRRQKMRAPVPTARKVLTLEDKKLLQAGNRQIHCA